MARLRFHRSRRSTNSTLLLLALGAVTGVALGVILADRAGGLDGVKSRLKRRRRPADDRDLEDLVEEIPALKDTSFHRTPVPAGVFEQHEPLPPDDADLEARVLEAFRNDPTLQGRAIDIGAIGDGIIELTGWVHSPAEVGHALTLARGVPDVAHVMDRLTIRGTDFSRAAPAAPRDASDH
jgi:hypothetical protein